MSDEPSTPESKPIAPPKEQNALQAAVASALVGLSALMPNPTVGKVLGILSPFVSIVVTQAYNWIVRIKSAEWEAEREAERPIVRIKKYIKELRKEAGGMPVGSAERMQVEQHIAEMRNKLHALRTGITQELQSTQVPEGEPPPGVQ